MRWVFGILGGYVALIVAMIVALPSIAHATPFVQYVAPDGRGHSLRVSSDRRLLWFIRPAETVAVYGRHGDLLDEAVLDDAWWVAIDHWDLDSVTIRIYRHGLPHHAGTRESTTTLNLEQ